MRKISKEELCKILDLHALWLRGDPNGERADLSDVDLAGADLKSAKLKGANLSKSDLTHANLHVADLRDADLSFADLRFANLTYANLDGADLFRVNISCANLYHAGMYQTRLRHADICNSNVSRAYMRQADLYNANFCGSILHDADLRDAENITTVKQDTGTAFLQLQCPEKGQYTGYKRLRRNLIAELVIPEHAKRSSATSRKCRASEAIVVSITDLSGERSYRTGRSMHDVEFQYVVGKTVVVQDFCDDRWSECAAGIHHFITREEAVHYNG